MNAKIITIAFIALLMMGCSSSEAPTELSNIEALKTPQAPKINEIRLSILKQTSRGLGAQAALAFRSRQLNILLNKQRRTLDRVFNFNYLILNKNVMPPVLEEGRNTLNLADEFSLRVSDRDFQIVSPPRFITATPTWRDYIWMLYKKPDAPSAALLPQNRDERKVWNEYIQIGWNDGLDQADNIFTANLNRMQRDFEGMILYRKLLAQHMVSMPYVSQADLGVTGGGNDMRINDRVLRITTIPQLQANPKEWQPVVTKRNGKSDDSLISQFRNFKK